MMAKGITVGKSRDKYAKKVTLRVNPSVLFDIDDLKLWKPTRKTIVELIRLIEKNIEEHFDSDLSDFELSRCDYTVNIDVKTQKAVSAYVAVLNNIGKVTGYKIKYPNHPDEFT